MPEVNSRDWTLVWDSTHNSIRKERRGPHRIPEVDWGKRIQQVLDVCTLPYKQRIIELEREIERLTEEYDRLFDLDIRAAIESQLEPYGPRITEALRRIEELEKK